VLRLPAADESEWEEMGEAEMVDLSVLQEALVDMAEQDSGPSSHNARISDDPADSEGLDPVTILHNVDTGLMVGAPGPAKLSQMDGA
jgi:hypothetical protein